MITCHSCSATFEDYKALAVHILSSKKHKGKKWAAKYIQRNVINTKKREYGQAPMTPEQLEKRREAKEEIQRVLSGITKSIVAKCPKCKNNHRKLLEEEFAECIEAWRIQGLIAALCPRCTSGRSYG